MPYYVLGHALGWTAFLAAAILTRSLHWTDERGCVALALLMPTLPALGAWLGAEIVHALRPRRILRARPGAAVRLTLLGIAGALLAAVIAAAGAAFATSMIHDLFIVTGAALLASLVTISVLPRHRRGRCVHCDYDLRGMTVLAAGRCTECGCLHTEG